MRVKPALPLVMLLVLSGVAGWGASCGNSEERPTTPDPPAERPPPTFRLLVVTDLKGYLEPCGCTSRPLGGIDRMAAKVAELRAEDPPTLLLVAGDVFFDGVEHGGVDPEAAAAQELWKAETLVEIFDQLEVAAVTPGHLDLSHGAHVFASLADAAEFSMLSGGVSIAVPGAEPDAEPRSAELDATLVREVGGVQVGVFGVSVLEGPDGSLPEGVTVDADARAAARTAVQALERQGADVVIGLVRGTRQTARRLATGIRNLDFVVQAGLDEADAIAPSEADGTHLLHGGRQGQGLLVVDVVHRAGGDFTDWSDWTTSEQRGRLERRIEDLEARIAEWEGADDVDEDDVARQRRRLAGLRRELEGLSVTITDGNGFSARWAELPPGSATTASVTELVDAYDRRVNEHNREAFADLVPEPAPEGQPHYVGSATCGNCHESELEWWTGHKHSVAYETLADQHKQYNLSCVGCHVTGYMQPGGSTVTHNLDGALTDVGCESCHGAGSRHVERELSRDIELEVPERLCVTCHNAEHSDTFDYDEYMEEIVVPGHGRAIED